MHTFAKLSAVFYSGLSFGSFFGPPLSGVLTQTVGFPWLQTVLAFQAFLMVSCLGQQDFRALAKWGL